MSDILLLPCEYVTVKRNRVDHFSVTVLNLQLQCLDHGWPAIGSGANDCYIERFQKLISSSFCLIAFMNWAAKAPSMIRWSDDRVIFMRDRIAI
jgi:hypothetical protein